MTHFTRIFSLSALTFVLSASVALAAPVAPAEALHTSLHRVEKLVALKQLDSSYATALQGGTVEAAPAGSAATAVYKVTLKQFVGAHGAQRALEILTDATGKEISHTLVDGGVALSPLVFSGVDTITLIEYAYHHVNANGDPAKPAVKAELVPFYVGNTGVELTQGVNAAGETAGVVEFKSSKSSQVLRIVVNTDTSIDSVTVIQ